VTVAASDAPVWAPVPIDNNVHVVPLNDLIDHDLTDTCTCGPNDQAVIRDDGSIGWVTIHHSLDGREQAEV
jgi:hypothetical protein